MTQPTTATPAAPSTCAGCGAALDYSDPFGQEAYGVYPCGTRLTVHSDGRHQYHKRCVAGWEWAAQHRASHAALVAALKALADECERDAKELSDIARDTYDEEAGNTASHWQDATEKIRTALAAAQERTP